MNNIDADPELVEYLQLSAREAGTPVAALLRQVLHVNPLTQEPGFQQLFGTAGSELRRLLMRLDQRLRVLNPGLHYVFRSTYLGYRREGGIAATAVSERTQIFVSLVPRSERLCVVLPVDPAPYAGQPGCRVLTGQGHHGVGDLQVDLPDENALDQFFKTFRDWLAPPRSHVEVLDNSGSGPVQLARSFATILWWPEALACPKRQDLASSGR